LTDPARAKRTTPRSIKARIRHRAPTRLPVPIQPLVEGGIGQPEDGGCCAPVHRGKDGQHPPRRDHRRGCDAAILRMDDAIAKTKAQGFAAMAQRTRAARLRA
jgi:hypothetical protein